jgi:hypothetical protein
MPPVPPPNGVPGGGSGFPVCSVPSAVPPGKSQGPARRPGIPGGPVPPYPVGPTPLGSEGAGTGNSHPPDGLRAKTGPPELERPSKPGKSAYDGPVPGVR